jgi:hypothetical protein
MPDTASSNGFTVLPESYFLPFISRSEEVSQLLSKPPNSRILTLLAQTFPQSSNDSADKPYNFKADPTTWDYNTLQAWLFTVDRSEVPDTLWVENAKRCIASKSELIWERVKTALGVPPDLDSDEEWDQVHIEPPEQSLDGGSEDEEAAALEPIYPGDAPIPSPLSPGVEGDGEDDAFGFGGRDGGMENIGESEEEGDAKAEKSKLKNRTVAPPSGELLPIHGIRITTSSVSVNPPLVRGLSLSRTSSLSSGSTVAPIARRDSVGRREATRQVRDPGNPLFLGSFANLTVGPTLVSR